MLEAFRKSREKRNCSLIALVDLFLFVLWISNSLILSAIFYESIKSETSVLPTYDA